MNYTPFEDINGLLQRIIDGTKNILQQQIVGMYLYGSLSTGDFDYALSDIDLLVLVQQDLTQEQFELLESFHEAIVQKFPVWRNRLEIAYISVQSAQQCMNGTGRVAIVSPGEQFHRKIMGADWIINLYLLRLSGVRLYGPSLTSIMPVISPDEFTKQVERQAIEWRDWIHHTQNSVAYQYYAVLTLCRALCVIQTGKQLSKIKAAQWVKERMPVWCTLIDEAIASRVRKNSLADDPSTTYFLVEQFVREIVNKIENGTSEKARS